MLKSQRIVLTLITSKAYKNKQAIYSLFKQWYSNPKMLQYIRTVTEKERKSMLKGFFDKPKTNKVFIVETINGGVKKAIGYCGLLNISRINGDAVFVILISEEYWGKDYGPEAAKLLLDYGFLKLNLNRVTSYTAEYNERSVKFHQEIGFKIEGRVRQALFWNQRYWDKICFGMLREKWEKRK